MTLKETKKKLMSFLKKPIDKFKKKYYNYYRKLREGLIPMFTFEQALLAIILTFFVTARFAYAVCRKNPKIYQMAISAAELLVLVFFFKSFWN